MQIKIPNTLKNKAGAHANGRQWLHELPSIITELCQRWQLSLAEPFTEDVTCAWVAPCTIPKGYVLKVGYPHFEAVHEIDGLLAIDGSCAARLIKYDKHYHAILMEQCVPGHSLRSEVDHVQDHVICDLLVELWQIPHDNQIRPLRAMIEQWCASARKRFATLRDHRDVVFRGIEMLDELATDNVENVLLATDLHAGNVLASHRRPWLIIDPKPHIGDPCYDLTQHFLNVQSRLDLALIESMSRSADVDAERVLRWTFGRLCLDPTNHALAVQLAKSI